MAPALVFEGHSFPPVLTTKAVASGLMPPLGLSALPPQLEAQIPPEFRYWTAKSEDEARDVRDELVERAVIKPSDVLKVDGVLQRVVWQAFIAVEDQAPAPLAKRSDVAVAGAMCIGLAKTAINCVGDTVTAERLAVLFKDDATCVALDDTAEHRAALSSFTAFTLETRPGVIFGAAQGQSVASTAHIIPVTTTKAHDVRLLRKAEAEERFVFGIVLEPDVVDSQNDTYSADEVRKSAHRFMEHHAQLGQQHATIVTGKLKILESYIAPVDFGEGAEVVKKGTWLLAIRVVDDGLWEMVKAGSFTGFSIGGTAIRQPEATPTA